jgi:LPPG:FO 2-phospho-L-lactate transferase
MSENGAFGRTIDGSKEVVAICGGVGGAKLALGLQHILGKRLTVVVNVGDDFDHMALRICPDIDTVLYTLAGLNDQSRGWGRSDETWNFMEAMKGLGGETWFALGDRDLALHVERTRRLRDGERLTKIVADIARKLGIASHILPVTEDSLRTKVMTSEGKLDFQRYFVERRCAPVVQEIHFEGAANARLTVEVSAALKSDQLGAVVICPSNPYLSVDPILAVCELKDFMKRRRVPIVAVSPLIGGKAVKGPTSKIMDELKIEPTSESVARHYSGLIDGLVIDRSDLKNAEAIETKVHPASTLMTDLDARISLAKEVLGFADRIRPS